MKILIYSDLHTELAPFSIPQGALEQADAVVLAGDIGIGKKVVPWIQENVGEKLTFWVWGNHEFYTGHLVSTRIKSERSLGGGSNIKILENRSFVIDGVRFLGCTLWTDCKIHEEILDTFVVINEMASRMTDYRRIRTGGSYRRLRVSDTIGEHLTSVRWLKQQLSEEFAGPTVVITHHAPHRECLNDVHDQYLDCAYASDLSDLIEDYKPDVWIYGHTHEKVDFMVGVTRLISNPLGYVSYGEKTGFDSHCIIEV
ncbi:MAG: metallophosphoesterase [Neptuniibacter sp.]